LKQAFDHMPDIDWQHHLEQPQADVSLDWEGRI
jgi:hypothetical protein